jgi:uncharacterized membrane protein
MANPQVNKKVRVSGKSTTTHPSAKSLTPRTHLGLERIIFFSDAVMAIAITLLALEIRLPEKLINSSDLFQELIRLSPHYLGFVISFFVIGLFWISHHRVFEYIQTYNNGLIWINLFFLFIIALIPFPTSVLGRFPAEFTSVVIYASFLVCLSLVRIWFWWYVYYRAKLVLPDIDPRAGRYEFMRALWTAGVFGGSIIIAFWSPRWAMYFWFLLLPITFIIRAKD